VEHFSSNALIVDALYAKAAIPAHVEILFLPKGRARFPEAGILFEEQVQKRQIIFRSLKSVGIIPLPTAKLRPQILTLTGEQLE
jgi:hypothetical protein